MNNILFLSHNICSEITKKGVSENGIIAYLSLASLYNKNKERMVLTLDCISDVLTPNKETNKRRMSDLKEGVEELSNNGYIKILENTGQKYTFDMSGLNCDLKTIKPTIDEDDPFCVPDYSQVNYYSMINIDSLVKIYKDNGYKKTVFKYLLYYINLKNQNENNTNGYEYLYFIKPIKSMVEEIKISETSILKYNKLLEDNKIIFIYHYSDTKNKKTTCNACGMYKDKNKIISSCEQFKRR